VARTLSRACRTNGRFSRRACRDAPPPEPELLAEPGTGHLSADIGLQAATGFLNSGSDSPFRVTKLGLHVCLQRSGNGGGELHPVSQPDTNMRTSGSLISLVRHLSGSRLCQIWRGDEKLAPQKTLLDGRELRSPPGLALGELGGINAPPLA
jgi:hypothetical protein